jgi:hypothetical protein
MRAQQYFEAYMRLAPVSEQYIHIAVMAINGANELYSSASFIGT